MPCTLPPGCRFYPSDEQLLCNYLTGKNEDSCDDLIKELNLYDYKPFDLPENVCFSYGYKGRKRHWYCYTKKFRVLKKGEECGRRRRKRRRIAKGGYWRSSGKVRDVVGPGGNVVIGTRSKFVFYLGNSVHDSLRTNWVLYEYALVHHVKASYVLCRVCVRSRGGNSVSENVVSSCAEESVSTVRHIGIQHDGCLTPDIVEAKVHHVKSVDSKTARSIPKFDDHVARGPAPASFYHFHSCINSKIDSNKLVGAPGLPCDDLLVDAETTQQSISILEGDFIELDDLVD